MEIEMGNGYFNRAPGVVHAMLLEHTLCGDAIEEHGGWVDDPSRKAVNCDRCRDAVLFARSVRLSPKPVNFFDAIFDPWGED